MATNEFKEQVAEETFKTLHELERNFNKLYDACTMDLERDALRSTLVAARDAYFRAEREKLEDDHEFVKGLLKELRYTNEEIQRRMQNLEHAEAIINLFGEAVKLVAAIAVLAAI